MAGCRAETGAPQEKRLQDTLVWNMGVFHCLLFDHFSGAAEYLTGHISSKGQTAELTINLGSCSLLQLLSAMPHSLGFTASYSKPLLDSPPLCCAHQSWLLCPSPHQPPQGTFIATISHASTPLVPVLLCSITGATSCTQQYSLHPVNTEQSSNNSSSPTENKSSDS